MNKLALNFLLVRRTLGENICLSCLKFNLPWAPGQVIFFTPGTDAENFQNKTVTCTTVLHPYFPKILYSVFNLIAHI